MPTQDRRKFLSSMVGGAAATAAVRPNNTSAQGRAKPLSALRPGTAQYATADERYWQMVKDQFPLKRGLILMNAANLCPSPYPVIDTVQKLTADVDADASFQNRAKFGELREVGRNLLASYLGAHPDEVAITRNTSEGNNTVLNGLTLGAGDEVVIWDQNHPTNNVAWDVRAERYGFSVTRVATPVAPQSRDELFQTFASAITPRTRALAFSHVSNASGVALPAKELCTFARERGVLTLVDGAQTFGAIRVNVHDMGCDFYTGSSHKWFMGPKEAGILYVRRDRIAGLWPSNVGVGWASAIENGAQKFENLGQRDDAAVAAMGTAAEFHMTIGIDEVESRVRALAGSIKDAIAEKFPGAVFATPLNPMLSAGVVVFSVPGVATSDLYSGLYIEHNIACAAMSDGLRLSPHIYNTLAEVDRLVEAIAQLV